MDVPRGLTLDRPGDDDFEAVLELILACDVAEIGEPDYTAADLTEDWSWPRLDRDRDLWVVRGAAGGVVGYAYVHISAGPAVAVDADVLVHPAAADAVTDLLLGRVAERAADVAGGSDGASVLVTIPCATGNARKAEALARAGYTVVRRFSRMRIDVADAAESPAAPPGVTVRGFAPGDEHTFHEVRTAAFSGLWEYRPETPAEFWNRQSRAAGFDTGLWWLASVDGVPAGALIGRALSPELGWVAIVGVVPEHRGRGIATLLLRQAFSAFRRRGCPRVDLGVDTGNDTGALRLYESVGMRVVAQHDMWRRAVRG